MTTASVEHRCPHCGTRNRVPAARTTEDPTCGRCRQPLFPGEPVVATDATFARVVEAAAIPCLVDFWAPWCGPCRAMEPVLEDVARRWRGRVQVVKVNVDENGTLAGRFAIRSIPALKLFRGGDVIDQIAGAVPAGSLESLLRRHAG